MDEKRILQGDINAMIIQILKTVLPVLIMLFLGMICRKSNYISADCVDGIKKIVVNIMLPITVFHGLATSVLGKETIFNIGMMFVILCATFILGFALKHFIRKPYDKYLPFIACGYEGGMIGYSLYTGLVGAENLSVIAVIDIAALLFTFSIMSNVLVLIEDGKKVSVIEIVQNAFKTPAFLAVILGILASVSGLMNGFMLSPAGVIWTSMKNMITAAMSPMILLVVGYEVQLNRELLGTCLKTVIIRAVMQLIFAVAAISLIHILGRSDRLLEIAIIVYMSLPGSMGIQAFIKDEDGGKYIANCNSIYLAVTIVVYAILAAVL